MEVGGFGVKQNKQSKNIYQKSNTMINPNINSYIETNKQRFLDELFELLRIPSVSADAAYKNDVIKTAAAIKEKLIAAGAEK